MSSAQNHSPVSLVENRNTERTIGCVGFSIFAHVAFLAALMTAPNSVHEQIDAGRKDGADQSVSMVDVDTAPVANETDAQVSPDASTTTAIAGDVAIPDNDVIPADDVVVPTAKEAVAIEPAKTPIVKSAKPVKKPAPPAKSVSLATPPLNSSSTQAPSQMTDASAETEAMPTLLANPPGDEASSDTSAQEDEEAAAPSAPAALPPTAATATATAASEPEATDEPASTSAPSAASDTDTNAKPKTNAGDGDDGSSGGEAGHADSPGAVVGPIRDASELKALPGNSNPVYPARDRLARKQGTAVILGRVSPDGHVTELKLEKSSGSQMMDAAAVQAFRSWRFQAGQEGWVRKPFQFRLVGDAKEIPTPLGKPLTR